MAVIILASTRNSLRVNMSQQMVKIIVRNKLPVLRVSRFSENQGNQPFSKKICCREQDIQRPTSQTYKHQVSQYLKRMVLIHKEYNKTNREMFRLNSAHKESQLKVQWQVR